MAMPKKCNALNASKDKQFPKGLI